MPLGTFLKLYFISIPIFFAIDLVWLGIVAKGFYRKHLGHLLRENVGWGAAILFYLIFIAGILVFAVLPAVERQSLRWAVLMGGLFGFVAYATYDLTNLATLKDFPPIVAVVDMLWGFILSATVAGAAFQVAQALGRV